LISCFILFSQKYTSSNTAILQEFLQIGFAIKFSEKTLSVFTTALNGMFTPYCMMIVAIQKWLRALILVQGVGGRRKADLILANNRQNKKNGSHNKNGHEIVFHGRKLVAGAGFEPTTFRL
jgi:hypothetical protein